MNITRENREQGTSLLKVVVDTNDYGEAVDKQLREMKRKANIPGFRPGMVPMPYSSICRRRRSTIWAM